MLVRFFLGLYVFSGINKLGFLRAELLFIITPPTGFLLLIMLALLFTILPLSASYGLMAVYIALHLSANIEIAATVFLFLLCLIFFYIRLAPRESILVLLTVLGFHFKLPYLAPMAAGMYFGLTSVIPVIAGVFIWTYIPGVLRLMDVTASAGLNVMELTETIPDIYESVVAMLTNNYNWIFVAFSFVMVIVTVYAFSRLSVSYAAEIAVLMGAVVNIAGHIVATVVARSDTGFFSVVFYTLLCSAAVIIIRFFDIALDYSRVERVQFSDEDNFYYVKIVPKLLTTLRTDKRAAAKTAPEPKSGTARHIKTEDTFIPGDVRLSSGSGAAAGATARYKAAPDALESILSSDRTDRYDEILRTDRPGRTARNTRTDRMDMYGRPIKPEAKGKDENPEHMPGKAGAATDGKRARPKRPGERGGL